MILATSSLQSTSTAALTLSSWFIYDCLLHFSLYPDSWRNNLLAVLAQFETIFQFFVGFYDDQGSYVDEIQLVFLRQVREPTRFLFDITTSIPWSYLDYFSYQVLYRLWWRQIFPFSFFKNIRTQEMKRCCKWQFKVALIWFLTGSGFKVLWWSFRKTTGKR